MPDVPFTLDPHGATEKVIWEGITNADALGAAHAPFQSRASIATVQFAGTFDGATATLQGSNDGTNWVTLRDTAQLDVSITEDDYAEISTAFLYLRPFTSGGGASQNLNCLLLARG